MMDGAASTSDGAERTIETRGAERSPLGVLILHGFTSSLDAVRPLVPIAERLGLPYRMPVLRGHGTRPEDLRGVTYRDWYADAEAALSDLRREVERVAVCGLSMGGLVALNLAADHPNDVAGVVTIAAALRIASPLIHLGKPISMVRGMWTPPPGRGYADQELAKLSTNYKSFATDAVLSLHRYGRVVTGMLGRVRQPLLILHSRKDGVIKPSSSDLLYERAGSLDKRRVWFERCNHELLLDCEAGAVCREIEQWLERLRDRFARECELTGARSPAR